MSLSFRRALYTSSIIIFLIAAPLLVAYTTGYRYDPYKQRFILTGSLFVRTHPEEVMIYLNDELVSTKSPLRLNHLLPNKYKLRIEKPGHTPWHKELEVTQKKTTFAEDIILWPARPNQTTLTTGTANNMTMDKQATKLFWQSDSAVLVLNTINQSVNTILSLPSTKPVSYIWSHDTARLIIQQENHYWLVHKNSLETQNLDAVTTNPEAQVSFHPDFPDTIFFLQNQNLVSYNTATRQRTTIVEGPIQDYYWHNNSWHYITANEPISLVTRSYPPDETDDIVYQLPTSQEYKFVSIIKNRAIISEPTQRTVYIFTLDPQEFNNTSQIISPVDQWAFNSDATQLLFNNEWEVWYLDLTTNQSTLITRVSEPITSASWYAHDGYVLLQFSDRVEMIEVDQRDFRNQSTLWRGERVIDSLLNPQGELLYIAGTSSPENTTTLKSLIIFEPKTLLP